MQNEFRTWYGNILDMISADVVKFYTRFYPNSTVESVGKDYRLEPCPFCNHKNCFTITPNIKGAQCFSGDCLVSGNHIKLLAIHYKNKGLSGGQAYADLAEFYNLPLADAQPTNIPTIREIAANFYTEQLLNLPKYLTYQLSDRKHSIESIKAFKVGVSFNYLTLRNQLLKSFTPEEIKEAKIFIPEGLFTYPYFDFTTGIVERINTKNPFEVKDKNGEKISGYSIGSKTLYKSPVINYDYAVLFEGENDLISYVEEGGVSGFAVGGNFSSDLLRKMDVILEKFSVIYTFFDNDPAGDNYTDLINDSFPHKQVFKIIYDKGFKDPDDYFKRNTNKLPLAELLSKAVKLSSDKYKVNFKDNIWSISNRVERLTFEINKIGKGRSFIGSMNYYKDNAIKDKAYDADLAKIKYKPLNFFLLEEMEEYYDKNFNNRSLGELIGIYRYSRFQNQIIKLFAKIIVENTSAKEDIITKIRVKLKDNVADLVLREEAAHYNLTKDIVAASIVKIPPGQFFHRANGDAFMYFTYVKQDGEHVRALPYYAARTLTGKELIRLDLYKRADPGCLLLLKNKYELTTEIDKSLGELQEVSLVQEWAEKYVNNEYTREDIHIPSLVRTIEQYSRKFVYFDNDISYKFLATWIFGTYCYGIFNEFPYLFINGAKGSGKTVLDCFLSAFCFNAKMSVNCSTASLFRTLAVEGGTFILDEMENIFSRNQTMDNTLADVLKGGYQSHGFIRRCNPEKDMTTEKFLVYGPKVISNINGLEDIISDRCVTIFMHTFDQSFYKNLEDPRTYCTERQGEIKAITSRCCMAVLDNHEKIFQHSQKFNSISTIGRLAKLMVPLYTVGNLVGPDYESAVDEYYNHFIVAEKVDTNLTTPEGALKEILRNIALEVVGAVGVENRYYLNPVMHKYKTPIEIDPDGEWFELDTLHIRTFVEEMLSDERINLKDINVWVKRVIKIDLSRDRSRRNATIDDEALVQELKGNYRIKVYAYKFYVKGILPKSEIRYKPVINKSTISSDIANNSEFILVD